MRIGILTAVCSTALFASITAFAQGLDGLPSAVASEVRAAEQVCRKDGGKPEYDPFSVVKAFYMSAVGAGREAFLVDKSKFLCMGGGRDPSIFCGSGGCTMIVFLPDGRGGWTRVHEDIAVGWSLAGGDDSAPNVRISFETIGTSCGRPRYESCFATYRADGGRLVRVP